jgi:ABC-type polysaccharide/polyol phosphate export permease
MVKLLLSAATLVLMVAAGKRYYPVGIQAPLVGFTMALLISTCSILSIGFLIASLVPTARFAQPIGAVIMYPMMAVSGLFAPVESLPPAAQAVAKVLPLTYAVSLLEGIWKGDAWWAHARDLMALAVAFCGVHCALGEIVSLGVTSICRSPRNLLQCRDGKTPILTPTPPSSKLDKAEYAKSGCVPLPWKRLALVRQLRRG